MSTETPLSTTPKTTLHRHKERGQTDRDDLYAVLDAGLICHLGVTIDGAPVVLPTAYGRQDDRLYLHGSSAGRSWPPTPASASRSRTSTGSSAPGRCSATR